MIDRSSRNLASLILITLAASALVSGCRPHVPDLAECRRDLPGDVAEGERLAREQMATDRNAGVDAGRALTREDGLAAGRTVGFNSTYPTAYNAAYSAQYTVAYNNAYNTGITSVIACENGHKIGVNVEVEKLALTMRQIQQYAPPPNPAKTTDSRFAKYAQEFGGESWEVDALPPDVLDALIRDAFDRVVDTTAMEEIKAQEEEDKRLLKEAVGRF